MNTEQPQDGKAPIRLAGALMAVDGPCCRCGGRARQTMYCEFEGLHGIKAPTPEEWGNEAICRECREAVESVARKAAIESRKANRIKREQERWVETQTKIIHNVNGKHQ